MQVDDRDSAKPDSESGDCEKDSESVHDGLYERSKNLLRSKYIVLLQSGKSLYICTRHAYPKKYQHFTFIPPAEVAQPLLFQ